MLILTKMRENETIGLIVFLFIMANLLGYWNIPYFSSFHEFTKNVVFTTYEKIFDENKSVPKKNKLSKNSQPIKTLSCDLTCLDGSMNQLFCRLPSPNPIVIKLDYNDNKVSYVSTSNKQIFTYLFTNKVDFVVDGIYYRILTENGSFSSGYYNRNENNWTPHNKGICTTIIN